MRLDQITEYKTSEVRKAVRKLGYVVSAANTVLSPGKFEGEHIASVFFYEKMMSGEPPTVSFDGIDVFELTDNEKKELGEPFSFYRLQYPDNGFIEGDFLTQEDIDEMNELEEQMSTEKDCPKCKGTGKQVVRIAAGPVKLITGETINNPAPIRAEGVCLACHGRGKV